MFTGLVESTCQVTATCRDGRGGMLLCVDLRGLSETIRPGDSVAINGVCLTATAVQDGCCSFDVGPQTLTCTTLGTLRPSDYVNVELPLKVGDRLAGHIVQGHVDGIGLVKAVQGQGQYLRLGIGVDAGLLGMLVPKGSVAIDGVSLTVADIEDWGFWVAIVPHTARVTTIGRLDVGRQVNIEVDVVVKAVRRYLELMEGRSGLTIDRLRSAGFC